VSFLDVENVANLERELDRIYIGNMKLHVNIPRYRKVGVEQEAGLSRVSAKQSGYNPVKYRSKEAGKAKEVRRPLEEKHSYADVVRNSLQGNWNGPSFYTQYQVWPWMVNSMVGCLM